MRQNLNGAAASALLGVMIASLAALPVSAGDSTTLPAAQASSVQRPNSRAALTRQEEIELLLDRITFGPRPGDFGRVKQMGLNKFLDQQLHPDRLDDSAMEARLAGLETLTTPTPELAEDVQQARREQRQRRLAALSQNGAAMAAGSSAPEDAPPASSPQPLRPGFHRFGQMSGPATDENQEAPAGSMVSSRADVSAAASQRSMMARSAGPRMPREILTQLGEEELLRAVYSQRQLQEVMVRFWMNHFNVFWNKGADQYYLTSFEENVIRPHALGNFEDLLVATAESPAMLFYLDNWMSVAPNQQNRPRPLMAGPGMFRPFSPFGPFGPRRLGQPSQRRNPKNRRGLNENYGRELMELHTIGLHYTQQDVIEVARCFTGWTIRRPRQGGGFFFNPRMHDYGKKVVLGYTIPAGQGIEDGLEVLHILAMSPHTAQHISYELCQKFVADQPPPGLVERAAQTYMKTHGDIPSVLQTILTSPEFYSQGAYRAKVKSPFEYVASALRALGAQTDGAPRLLSLIAQMGEPMFQYEEPSGYDDVARTWINSGALLARMNFAIALGLNRIPGTKVDWQALTRAEDGEPPRMMMNQLAWQLTGGELSPATENAILAKLTSGSPADWGDFKPGQQTRMIASLMIASPEFQRR
ncbi:MAG: DUF1800 domain-containing protein [Terriglobia bacterium]